MVTQPSCIIVHYMAGEDDAIDSKQYLGLDHSHIEGLSSVLLMSV